MLEAIQSKQNKIGSNASIYIISEMSANHSGNFETAIKIFNEAKV
jgi:sialic acid synthase SpsE